ncbi:MAG: gamma-glutamyltransferase family protein [Fimbriimonadia bacterium]
MTWQHTRGIVYARRGLACTSHPLASSAGLTVLHTGGSVFDAAIAVSAVLCVVEPSASHLGGDGFAVLFDASRSEVLAANGAGPSPAAGPLSPKHEERGAHAFTVPGLVRLWQRLHERYGRLPFASLLTDAIELAEKGCPVGRRWARAAAGHLGVLRSSKETCEQFLIEGQAPAEGTIVRQQNLAATLYDLASCGPGDFYDGRIGRKLVASLRSLGSAVTEQDLSGFDISLEPPLRIGYRGFDVCGQPPMSQGIVLLEALGILEGFAIARLEPGSADLIHLQVEAHKAAFADRLATLGDGSEVWTHLLSPKTLADRRRTIDPLRASGVGLGPGRAGTDTTSFCIADGEGNAISFIQSVFLPWGAAVVAPGLGILMNNRMNGFDPGEGPNSYAPGKRPVHTLNTYLALKNGRVAFLGGTPGGHVQVQTNLQVIQCIADFGMDAQEAAERPRWAYRTPGWLGRGDLTLDIEDKSDPSAVEQLRARGHPARSIPPWTHPSAVQVIRVAEDGVMSAGSDPRADGQAVGW